MKWIVALISILLISVISKAQRPTEVKKAQLVYQKINKTLIEQLPLYEKRAICITENLIQNNAIQNIDESYFNFTYINETDTFTFAFTNESEVMDLISLKIDSASFKCTIVGYFAIVIIAMVLLVVFICLAFLQR